MTISRETNRIELWTTASRRWSHVPRSRGGYSTWLEDHHGIFLTQTSYGVLWSSNYNNIHNLNVHQVTYAHSNCSSVFIRLRRLVYVEFLRTRAFELYPDYLLIYPLSTVVRNRTRNKMKISPNQKRTLQKNVQYMYAWIHADFEAHWSKQILKICRQNNLSTMICITHLFCFI